MSPSSAPLSDATLHALADGRLPAAEAEALRARLSPEQAGRVEGWTAQTRALKQLHQAVLDEPVPEALRAALPRPGSRPRERAAPAPLWHGAWAAGVVLAFAAGWGLHGARPGAMAGTQALAMGGFGQQAAIAHAVFAPEVRHPVDVDAQQRQHLVQWLSKRLGQPLRVPDLTPQGYHLLGGRLLPGEPGAARAQFMFESAQGRRLTLYLGGLNGEANARETAFQFRQQTGVATFYWVDRGWGYALSGDLPRAELLDVARRVHEQL